VRVTAEWGSLEAASALRTADRKSIIVPAPAKIDGSVIVGDGWRLTPARGWTVRPASRPGDYRLVREKPQRPDSTNPFTETVAHDASRCCSDQ
jgi:hypothetical protein